MSHPKNKTIFITGASAGIGRACAEVFAREGARLIISARREKQLSELAAELNRQYKTEVHQITLDIRNHKDISSAIDNLPDKFKEIDLLINNAGLSRGLTKLHEGNLSDWEEMIDTNIKGLLYISRAIIPGMVKRGAGQIINIGSVAGHQLYPGGNVYCATKHAVDAITRGMQIDLVDSPIRVSSVDPGMVETEFSLVRFHGDTAKAKKAYEGMTPLKGEDVAEAVLFCATRPPHVNLHQIRIMPNDQATATIAFRRK